MIDLLAQLRTLTLPSNAGPNDPAIVIGDEIPANLTAYYALVGRTVVAAIIYRLDSDDYTYDALVTQGSDHYIARGASNGGAVLEQFGIGTFGALVLTTFGNIGGANVSFGNSVFSDAVISLWGSLSVEVGPVDLQSAVILGVQSGAEIEVNSGGLLTVESGGDINVNSGGEINVSGNMDVENGGMVNVQSGGEIEIESGGILDIQLGSTFTADTVSMPRGWRAFKGSTASSGAIGAETAILTTGGFVPRNDRAYRMTFSGDITHSAANTCTLRIRKNTAAGAVVAGAFNYVAAAGLSDWKEFSIVCRNITGSDIASYNVCVTMQATAGTCTANHAASRPFAVHVEDIGDATDFPNACALA